MTADDAARGITNSLPDALPGYMAKQRWFRSKARNIATIRLDDMASLPGGSRLYFLTLVRVEYDGGCPEVYYLPLAVTARGGGAAVDPAKLISSISVGTETADVHEASEDETFNRMILAAIEESASVKARRGSFAFEHTDLLPGGGPASVPAGSIKKIDAEQSNTSIVFADALIMKNYRKLEEGTNPDFDISHFLTTRTDFRSFPALLGYAEYRKAGDGKATVGMLQSYIRGTDDCWEWTCGHLRSLYASLSSPPHQTEPERKERIGRVCGEYLGRIRELGRTTARFHIALASDHDLPSFAPEPITAGDAGRWQSLFSSQIRTVLGLAAEKIDRLPVSIRRELSSITSNEASLLAMLKELGRLGEEGVTKIRVHGDYHLGQALVREGTFFLLDFEGEPARPLAERKAKNCALKDIAGMLRSFDYAAHAVLFEMAGEGTGGLEEWGMAWRDAARTSFLDGYLGETGERGVSFLPRSRETLHAVLSIYEMDKAVYELDYEMNNRPGWLKIPVRGLYNILGRHTRPGQAEFS